MTNYTNEEALEIKEIKRLENIMRICIGIAILIFIIVFGVYIIKFGKWELAKDKGDWGTFGDYVGGLLNPTIAALALFWLITSVKLQIKELKKTNEALAETVKSAKKQQEQVSLQNFESLFFQLLKTKNEVTNDIVLNGDQYKTSTTIEDSSFRGKDAFKGCIHDFKTYQKYKSWEDYYKENLLDYFGSYFRVCYQIVKLIDQNETLKLFDINKKTGYSSKQKEYFDIFRATLTQHELETFFFNCLCIYGNGKFKKLLEKYGMFEPLLMDFNYSPDKYHRLSSYAYHYKKDIFEKNNNWLKYFDDLDKIEVNCDQDLIQQNVKMIKDLKLHLNHNKSTDTYSILSIEKLDEEIKSSIKYYSEFFPQGINPELLSFMDKNTYYYYEKLKSINLDFEVYVCIKYDLDIKEIIEYRNALFKVD
ncbi:hypothetical protein B9Y01_12270 [Acinetobacter baumannii]|jgi:uncharacterized membrane protein|uniref:putative phage abortive infection protein n=1 Tax=Acinetobacter calcoaceticus/baumannii complex TaxID=909768 RepID=UPI0004526251|nr:MULTISPECIES: putative phage abortive infection protein [Acinetobacter calcoaceticus/baumannii complex]EXE75534.1 hypothetical protein J582_3038 [Acinetobacter sp. 1566109]MBJ9959285.1 hypothetical protein [Acinetobacter nosocomialis]MBR7686160.1 hypothetical protein [Acinetobacter nosocomialis]MBR7701671.1 hypothetical protein [Acinetobacter nosocomialis]MBR7760873.1 hypothetical protein [Acinetobacter nosocomialis]